MEAEKNKMLAEVCMGLSEVCVILSQQKQDDLSFMDGKLKIMKKHNPDDINIEVMKTLMRKKKENHKRYAIKFKKKAQVFKALSKLHKVNSQGGKNGKRK